MSTFFKHGPHEHAAALDHAEADVADIAVRVGNTMLAPEMTSTGSGPTFVAARPDAGEDKRRQRKARRRQRQWSSTAGHQPQREGVRFMLELIVGS